MDIIFALYAFKYNIIYMLIIACLFKKAIGARDKVHKDIWCGLNAWCLNALVLVQSDMNEFKLTNYRLYFIIIQFV